MLVADQYQVGTTQANQNGGTDCRASGDSNADRTILKMKPHLTVYCENTVDGF